MNNTHNFDADLQIRRLKAGEESALHYLQVHLYRRMMRTALQTTDSASVAEDAVAATLMKIWRKRDLLPETWDECSRYVLSMTANATLDVIRRKEESVSKLPLEEARLVEASSDAVEEDSFELADEAIEQLERLLLPCLRERHLRVLRPISNVLSREDEPNMQQVYADVASTSGMSSGAVRNSWSDAGQRLQTILRGLGWTDYRDDDVRFILRRIGERQASVC